MRRLISFVFLLGASACSERLERSDQTFLKECWGAVERREGGYELAFEGLIIEAGHGGTLMRSSSCPDHRLHVHQWEGTAETQVAPIREAAREFDFVGVGIRGRAIVLSQRREGEFHLYVRVMALPRIEAMTPEETNRFIHRFNIG